MTPIDLRQAARGERDTNSRASGGGAPGTGVGEAGDPAYTVSERGQAVAVNLRGREEGARPELSDVASARAASGGSTRSYLLTDGRGDASPEDPAPDGRRYAAVGDAVTVNVAEWIGRRLALFEAGEP